MLPKIPSIQKPAPQGDVRQATTAAAGASATNHFNDDQPRFPKGHPHGGRWTNVGGHAGNAGPAPIISDEGVIPQPIFARPRPSSPIIPPPFPSPPQSSPLPTFPFITTLQVGLAFLAWLSARSDKDRVPVFEFLAKDIIYAGSGKNVAVGVSSMTREQVSKVCEQFDHVQTLTDAAVDKYEGKGLSRAQFGTAVHTDVKGEIEKPPVKPNFRAEVSIRKFLLEWQKDAEGEEYIARYGLKNSVRIDVLENVDDDTVCVYDIKTGISRNSGLDDERIMEIARAVKNRYPHIRRIVIVEVRPSV
jgi:hypothetical protein